MRALLVAVVLVVVVGCGGDPGSEAAGEGVGREVAASTARPVSLHAVRFASAVDDLASLPALHADIDVTIAGVTTSGWLERDGASGRWRADFGDDTVVDSDDPADREPTLRAALDVATVGPELETLIGDGIAATLTRRAGAYGIEAGVRVAEGDGRAVEYWISEDSGLLTTVAVDQNDGASFVVRFTPLPAALVIASPT